MTQTPEGVDRPEPKSADELLAGAVTGFAISHAFVHPEAARLRIGAARMFLAGAGALIHESLVASGLTDGDIENLAARGELDGVVNVLAADKIQEINDHLQTLDGAARDALAAEVRFGEGEQGQAGNGYLAL